LGQNVDTITEAYHGKLGPRLAQTTRDRIHWMIKNVTGTTILDVGTSQGLVPILLGREGKKVTGIDLSKESIAFANESLFSEQEDIKELVTFVQGNFLHEELPENHFETIIVSHVLDQYSNSKTILEKASSLLKDDGQIIITVPFGMSGATDQKRTFYLMELYQEMSPYFKVDTVEFMGKWMGLVGTKGENPAASVPVSLFIQAEKAFYANERELSVELIENQSKLNETTRALNRKIEESKTVINGLHADNLQLEESMTNIIKNYNLEKSKLVDTNKKLSEANKTLTGQVEKKEQQVTEAKNTINQLQKDIASLKHSALLQNEKLERLEEDKQSLQERVDLLLLQSQREMKKAGEEIKQLQQQTEFAKNKIEELEKEILTLQVKNESLSLQLLNNENMIQQFENENHSLHENIKQAQQEKEAALVKHLAELEEIEKELATQMNTSKQAIEELTKKVTGLEADLVQEKGKLNSVVATKREELQSLTTEMLTLKRSNQITENEYKKEVLQLKEDLSSLLEEAEDVTKQLIRVMKDKEKLQHKYDSLKNSKLGKMTMKYWELRRK
jgi:ubiquinone/menaquinone biosynthesis C-methylase UbiE/chromosome segregation ATPase